MHDTLDTNQGPISDELDWCRVVADQRFVGYDLFYRDGSRGTTTRGPIGSMAFIGSGHVFMRIELAWAAVQADGEEWVEASGVEKELIFKADGPGALQRTSTGLLLFHAGKIAAAILPEGDRLNRSLVASKPAKPQV